MNQKQFEAGKSISDLGKVFASSILPWIRSSGLYGNGYELTIHVGQPYVLESGDTLTATIHLENEKGFSEGFIYHHYLGKGWEKLHEPRVLPDDVRKVEPDKGYPRSGEEAEKPFAPDGLWISAYDDTPDVVDRWDLK